MRPGGARVIILISTRRRICPTDGGAPEEIAAIAVFPACADSSYIGGKTIHGKTIHADGGRRGLIYVVPVPDETTG